VWCCCFRCIKLIENPSAFRISHFVCGFKAIPQIPIELNVTPLKTQLRAASDACDLFYLFNVILLLNAGCLISWFVVVVLFRV
jgi:hypothetical protein